MRKFFASIIAIWLLGFALFSVTLPQPITGEKTDAVIVPTGGAGRIQRGLEIVDLGLADMVLITGVDPEVTPGEFAAQFNVSGEQMECCITLGYSAVDTVGNGVEAAQWISERGIGSVRLVTTDWHMRRAANELGKSLPQNIILIRDAVASEPSLSALFLEYHKLIYSWASGLWQ